jgi:hypothetical protein
MGSGKRYVRCQPCPELLELDLHPAVGKIDRLNLDGTPEQRIRIRNNQNVVYPSDFFSFDLFPASVGPLSHQGHALQKIDPSESN